MSALMCQWIVAAWIWPFGKRDKTEEDDGTIGSLESRTVQVEEDAGIEASQQRAIQSYRALLELQFEDPALRAEAMRRLADLQLEASEDGQIDAETAAELALSEDENYTAAVKLYRELLESYPDYERNDVVLYQLARAYENTGQKEAALETLNGLIRNFPDSTHWDEAQFRRGEILFVMKDYFEAEQAYAAVLEYGQGSSFYEQALYKHGWSAFKQSENERGAASFIALLDLRLVAPENGGLVDLESLPRAERELLQDALRVLSISFSYLDGAESINALLAGRGEVVYAHLLFTSLGDLYLDQERYTDAAQTYRAFVDRDPNHLGAPLLLVQVIEAYNQAGFPALVLDSKREFVERYGLESTFWTVHSQEEAPKVLEHLKSNLMDLAGYHHALAQEKGKAEDFDEAARWYRAYLRYFPEDPTAPNTNFLLAEMLFEHSQYEQATREYERTAYGYTFHDKSAEAGYAALLAYTKHEEALAAGPEREAWHRESIESSLRFARTYPEHAEAGTVLTRAAEDLFELDELDLAIEAAGLVIARRPPVTAKQQRVAWTVIAHSRFDLGEFAESEGAYLQVQSLMSRDDEAWDDVVERIASSIYKQGEAEKSAGNLEAAVAHFQRVRQVTPGSEIVVTADYDAAAALVQMAAWGQAVTALEAFRRNYPEHEDQDEITKNLAVAYIEASEPSQAAREFERIATSADEGFDVQREAQWRAAELYQQANDRMSARSALEIYVQRFPEPLDAAMEGRQELADMAREDGDILGYHDWLNAIVLADATAGELATDRSHTLAARASLELAHPTRDAFAAVRLMVPLKDSLVVKKARMEEALDAYGRAADYRIVDVTTAATFNIAEIYNEFSRSLFDSERPAELSPQELEQYEILLEEQAFPFEEKAIEIHEANTRRARDGTYDEWVRKSFAELAELLPVRYAKAEISENHVEILH